MPKDQLRVDQLLPRTRLNTPASPLYYKSSGRRRRRAQMSNDKERPRLMRETISSLEVEVKDPFIGSGILL